MNGTPTQQRAGAKIHVDVVANPSVATNWLWSPEPNATCELLSIYMVLTTDVNAANRTLRIKFYDGTRETIFAIPNQIQIASLACPYYFAQGYTNTNIPATEVFRSGALPINYIFPNTWTISSDLHNVQAGDQLSNIVITWLRYLSF